MGVITKTVTVRHSPAETSPGALVAALNAAHLDASLTSARKQASVKRSWVPPWNVLLAAALLLVSCLHYLAGPTGVPRPVFDLTLHFDRLPGQFCVLLERLAGHYIEHWPRRCRLPMFHSALS